MFSSLCPVTIHERRTMEVFVVRLIFRQCGVAIHVSQRVVVLNFGQKLAEGSPASIQANPEVRAAYLGASEDS